MCIASGGETAFELLAAGAKDVTAVDVNPSQVMLVRLKAALYRLLPAQDLREVFTVGNRATLARISSALPDELSKFAGDRSSSFRRGLNSSGRIDAQLTRAMRLFLGLVHSKKVVHAMLTQSSLEAQERYFREHWDTWRWRLGLRLAFSDFALRRVFGREFGQLVPSDFGEQVRRDLETLLTTVTVSDNRFLWEIFANVTPDGARPPWLTDYGVARMGQLVGRLGVEHVDATRWLSEQPPGSLDLVCLSNILDGSSESECDELVPALVRALASGGVVVTRSLFAHIQPIEARMRDQFEPVEISDWTNRSPLCGRVAVLRAR